MVEKLWENGGKMVGKWWENCWKPNVTEASTDLFCAQILQENGKPDCMTLSTMPPTNDKYLNIQKRWPVYTCQFPCSAHTCYKSKLHIQMLNFTGNNRHPPTVNSAQCQLLIWVSVGLWTYGRHRRTKDLCNRFGTTDHSVPQFRDAKVKKMPCCWCPDLLNFWNGCIV